MPGLYRMKVCILGASGMLGHAMLYELSQCSGLEVWGTVRNEASVSGLLPACCLGRLVGGVDANDFDSIAKALGEIEPEVVVNCIGLIRQLPEGQQPLPCIEINARLPHLLLGLCRKIGSRLIHYSSDCVFDGNKGSPYLEDDQCSAKDVYGLTKYLGEVHDKPALTIRTSIIGHELRNKLSLVEWFMAQRGQVNGYRRAIYSGLPTVEHARILAEYILPNKDLFGLFQVASNPISKYELLCLIAREYGLMVTINPSDGVVEDKRLSGQLFYKATGYVPPDWPELVKAMHRGNESFNKARR